MNLLPFQINLSGIRTGDSAHSFHHLGTACAYQPGKTKDFSGSYLKGNVLKISGSGKLFYLQDLLSRLNLWLREKIRDLTSHHCLDQICIGNSVYIIGSDILGITEYRNSGSQTVHILKTMRNKNNGNSL